MRQGKKIIIFTVKDRNNDQYLPNITIVTKHSNTHILELPNNYLPFFFAHIYALVMITQK